MMQFVARTTLYKVEGNVETPIAEDASERFDDFSEGAEEFEARTDCDIDDCLLVDLAAAGIDASELVEAGDAEDDNDA